MQKILDHYIIFERLKDTKKIEFQNVLKKYSKDPYIQFLEANSIAGRNHITQALYISLLAFRREVNFTKNLQLELLVTLSQSRQIKKAIKLMAPKNNDIILVAFGKEKNKVEKVFNEVREKLKGYKEEIKPNSKKLEELFCIKSHPIYLHQELICEKMALIETLR